MSQVDYDLDGPPDGEAVVLIHGVGLCREIWRSYIQHFAQKYRVLSYDLYGHGGCSPASKELSLQRFAIQTDALMHDVGMDAAHIIGFSIGGMINRRLAMDFPQRCKSLVIMNAPHDRGVAGQNEVEARALKVQHEGKMATLPAALERWFTPSFREKNPAMLHEVKRWRQIADDRSYAEAYWVLAHGVRELIRPDPPLTLPACVMTTAHDTGSTPDMAKMIASEIADSQLVILPELQHLGMMEHPHAFISVIEDFLAP